MNEKNAVTVSRSLRDLIYDESKLQLLFTVRSIRQRKHLDVTYFKIRYELKFQFRLKIFVFVKKNLYRTKPPH